MDYNIPRNLESSLHGVRQPSTSLVNPSATVFKITPFFLYVKGVLFLNFHRISKQFQYWDERASAENHWIENQWTPFRVLPKEVFHGCGISILATTFVA